MKVFYFVISSFILDLSDIDATSSYRRFVSGSMRSESKRSSRLLFYSLLKRRLTNDRSRDTIKGQSFVVPSTAVEPFRDSRPRDYVCRDYAQFILEVCCTEARGARWIFILDRWPKRQCVDRATLVIIVHKLTSSLFFNEVSSLIF